MLFLALLFVACYKAINVGNGSTAKTSQIDKSGEDIADIVGEQLKSDMVKVIVELPDGWEQVKGSVLEHQYMKNTASFMVKTENFTNNTLDDVVNEAIEIYTKIFADFKTQIPEKISIDGKEARKLTFTCTVSNMDMKYFYVYLFAGGKTYVLTFGDLLNSFDSLSEDYEVILDSIQFIQ